MLFDIIDEQNRICYITCVMLCYITCVCYVMLCNICHVMLYDMFHVMLYDMCHVLLYNMCHVRNGPLENLWGGGQSTKKIFAQGKIK